MGDHAGILSAVVYLSFLLSRTNKFRAGTYYYSFCYLITIRYLLISLGPAWMDLVIRWLTVLVKIFVMLADSLGWNYNG